MTNVQQMQLKIGDRVGLKHDITKGVVVDINQDKVTIETDEGFVLTYLKKDLIRYQSHLDDLSTVVKKDHQKTTPAKKSKPFSNVIDLHCYDDKAQQHILDRQMQLFKTELQKGINRNVKSMVFIHGAGKGILRQKIESYLQKKHINYADAPYAKYGTQGAIEIFL